MNSPKTARALPNFRIRQWLLVGALCGFGIWLAVNRKTAPPLEFDSVSMAGEKADYYLESFTLLSTSPDGTADYILKADTLIHLPLEALAKVSNPRLDVSGEGATDNHWKLSASSGELPDHGQIIDLIGEVELQQLVDDQTSVRLLTPQLRLDRQAMEFSSHSGVLVDSAGWQLRADNMTGLVNTGNLIFRDNSHVQYAPTKAQQ